MRQSRTVLQWCVAPVAPMAPVPPVASRLGIRAAQGEEGPHEGEAWGRKGVEPKGPDG